MSRGSADVLFGMQRGDEGKGRFIDALMPDYSTVVRYAGGPNAGHTVVIEGQEISLHQIPSGILHEGKMNVCGNGMVIDPIKLQAEIDALRSVGVDVDSHNLAVSGSAYTILPHHIYMDRLREASENGQGSTSSGIAFAYADKAARRGAFMKLIADNPEKLAQLARDGVADNNPIYRTKKGDLIDLDPNRVVSAWQRKLRTDEVGGYIANTFNLLEDTLERGENILLEGAQGALLDIESGMKPYVTSSDTGVVGAQKGSGILHTDIRTVYGVYKNLPSHVGGGPFVSDIEIISGPEVADIARGTFGEPDAEYGKTTQRKRRVGYLDIPVLKAALRFNKVDQMLGTKLDVLEKIRDIGRIPIVIAYQSREGGTLEVAPDDAEELETCLPVIKYLPFWAGTVKHARKRADLPKEAQSYIEFIEEQTGVPTTMIGVGYGREELVTE